jgi:tetratricopeptide (TPR) repeat protein
LDVLRAATSKLIANDAMYFSLLISDNEEDSDDEEEEEEVLDLFSGSHKNLALQYFAKADFYRFQQKEEEAMKMLDSVFIVSPYGTLIDDAYFQKAQILIKQSNYIKAEEYLLKILKDYPHDILGDDATYLLAQLYEYYLKDMTKAMEYYQALLKNYPGSLFVVDARKKFRELRGDTL